MKIKKITFPLKEICDLKARLNTTGKIGTTRISDEFGIYHVGDTVSSEFGLLQVTHVISGKKLADHPYYNELTQEWKIKIGNNSFDYIILQRKKLLQE
jgi:hypothetical protein